MSKCIFPNVNFQFFNFARFFKKNDATQFAVLENIMLVVVKSFLPMKIGESIWLHTYRSTKNYSDVCGTCIGQLLISHMHTDLWMHHIFFIVIKFLSSDSKMKHVIVGLFGVTNINEAIMFSKL